MADHQWAAPNGQAAASALLGVDRHERRGRPRQERTRPKTRRDPVDPDDISDRYRERHATGPRP